MIAFTEPWAILPAKLIEMNSYTLEGDISLAAKGNNRPIGSSTKAGNVAVIEIVGPIMKRLDLMAIIFGGVTYADVQGAIQAALDDSSITGLVLKIDSPGGTVSGAFELSDFIFNARGKKPIIAYADDMAASAAYLIASAANRILSPVSAQVGSIGVVNIHTETSGADQMAGIKRTVLSSGRYKALSNQFEPLSKDGRDDIQARLDYFYGLFIKAVARNRGISEQKALSMADGKVFIGQQALDVGLIDVIGDFNLTISWAQGKKPAAATVTAKTASYEELVNATQQQLKCSHQETAKAVLETEAGKAAFLDKVRNAQ